MDVSSNRYGSLASCCFPLAAVIPRARRGGARVFPRHASMGVSPEQTSGKRVSFHGAPLDEDGLPRQALVAHRSVRPRRERKHLSRGDLGDAKSTGPVCGAMRNTSRPDITKRTFPEPIFSPRPTPGIISSLSRRAFSRTNGHHFEGVTTPPADRARGMGDGEESCAVCSLSIGGPSSKTLTAECCRRRFHDLCIARHCATRRDEVPSPRTRRVFGGVVVHAPKRATIDRPDHQRLDGPFTFPSPPPPRRTAGFLRPRAPPAARKLAADAVVAGASNAHRRVKRGRLLWKISVPKSARPSTARGVRRLFDVPRAPATDRGRESARDGKGGGTRCRGGRDRPGRGLEAGKYRGYGVAARQRARARASSRETNPRLGFRGTFSRVARAISRPPRRACGGSRARSSGQCTQAGKTRTRRRSTSAGAGGTARDAPEPAAAAAAAAARSGGGQPHSSGDLTFRCTTGIV